MSLDYNLDTKNVVHMNLNSYTWLVELETCRKSDLHLGDLAGLMIASKNGDSIPISDFQNN